MQVTAKSVQYSTVIYFISIKSKEYIQVHQNSVQLSTPELSAVYDIKDPSRTMRTVLYIKVKMIRTVTVQ